MAKIVVLGLQGESGLWVVDLDAGSVAAVQTPLTGALKNADDLRQAGATVTKGINLAALATSLEATAGGYMDTEGFAEPPAGGYMDK